MEDFSKTFSTSGSRTKLHQRWLSSGPAQMSSVKTLPDAPTTSTGSHPSTNPQFSKINSIATSLESQLQQLRKQNKTGLHSTDWQHENLQEISSYSQLITQNTELENQLKGRINKKIAKLDQQMTEMYRNKTAELKRTDKELRENVEEAVAVKNRCFEDLNKNKTKLYDIVNASIHELKKDSIQFVRENQTFRDEMFGKLGNVRARLMIQVIDEEKRRKTYNDIIHDLLERSCQKAQQMLRRKM